MLFRFVISQRDILPPGQYLLAFLFCRNFCMEFENEPPASFFFFMPKSRKGGLQEYSGGTRHKKGEKNEIRI